MFSPRCEKRCTTLSTSRRLPSIMLWRAFLSPARARVSRSRFSCSDSIGSSAVFTPHSSTLLYIPYPPVSFQFHRKYGRRGRITFIPNSGGYSPNCSLNCRMILFSSLEI